MTRIFLILAGMAVLLLCTNIVLGLRIDDYNGSVSKQFEAGQQLIEIDASIERLKRIRPRPTEEIEALREERKNQAKAIDRDFGSTNRSFFVHYMFGIVASLMTLLVNSISVTYFIGTSRWVREVAETYDFPKDFIAESNSIKRSTFPWALVSMLTVVGIIALGQAANPGIIREGTAFWVTPHLIGAILGTLLITFSFYRQGQNIATNYELIEQIVGRVQHVRHEKGLDDDTPPNHEKPIKPEYHDTLTG